MNAINAVPTELDAHEQGARAPTLTKADGSPLSVMVDGFNLSLEKGTGVATYARNLSFCLRDLGCHVGVLYGASTSRRHSPLLKEVSFYDSQSLTLDRWQRFKKRVRCSISLNSNDAFEVPIAGHVVPDSFSSRLPHYDSIWNATDLYLKASTQFEAFGITNRVSVEKTPDICHWTYPLPVRVKGARNIYTLHDLVPLRLPHTTLDKKDRYLALIRWIAKTADHIVTVSEASRRDLIEVAGIPADRVTNTYQAVTLPDKYRLKPDAIVRSEVEGMFGLGFKNYYLFFGSIEPKKNVGRLIESYLASGVNAPLVIVGAQSWKSDNELRPLAYEKVRQLMPHTLNTGASRKIVQLEYVSLSLLVSLIRGAKSVLFPSLYEGFGLPVLESMLLGTPVLSSTTSSIPEVAGDAALLVNPYDVREIAEGIVALDTNPSLRSELAHRGQQRAALFSQAAYAKRLASVYEQVLGSAVSKRAAT